MPRDSLRLQAEEAFADPAWRAALGHAVSVRAAENAPDPCRGLQGYVTTYQGVAAAPDLHLAEFRRHRTLLVVDEVHHLPALGRYGADRPSRDPAAPDAAAGGRAHVAAAGTAAVRLLLSGTLERADGRGILWLPYRRGPRAEPARSTWRRRAGPWWATRGPQALAERAVLPVTVRRRWTARPSWLDEDARADVGPHRLVAAGRPRPRARRCSPRCAPASPSELLRAGVRRDARPAGRAPARAAGLAPGEDAGASASCWWWRPTRSMPGAISTAARLDAARRRPSATVRLATSDERDAHGDAGRLPPAAGARVLVTVAMAYEGLDAPRSRWWRR